jgi:nucleoside-diphosphate-sugar epimerase
MHASAPYARECLATPIRTPWQRSATIGEEVAVVRVIVLGGTGFVGRAVTGALVEAGCEVLVVHRGLLEAGGGSRAEHLHLERSAWPEHRADFAAFAPGAAVDVSAGNGTGAEAALSALQPGIRLVALSSCDVYRAYESLHAGRHTDLVPLTEDSPLRAGRYLEGPEWENLEIEERYLAAGAAVLRLGAVYGEHDRQRRFEPVLRRVRAGRTRMPVGSGGWLFSRVYVGDVGQAVVKALQAERTTGAVFNVVEDQTAPIRLFFEQIIAASGADLSLVGVPDQALPPDLSVSGSLGQHLLASPARARLVLGWHAADPDQAIRRSVSWHIAHPPDQWSQDFTLDDAALTQL